MTTDRFIITPKRFSELTPDDIVITGGDLHGAEIHGTKFRTTNLPLPDVPTMAVPPASETRRRTGAGAV